MTKAEIRKKFDEIVAFAEVERFLDTPVKRYSSGMYVRLAFAVAAHLEPEILTVDEVLAVGDASFQKKCLGKMKEVSGKGGRTVLFVSHNMHAISTLTEKCILMNQGQIQGQGSSEDIIGNYLKTDSKVGPFYENKRKTNLPHVTNINLITSKPAGIQESGKPLEIIFEVFEPSSAQDRTFSFQILDSFDRPIIHLWRYDQESPFLRKSGTNRFRCKIPKCRLNIGQYSLKTYLAGPPGRPVDEVLEGICCFEVVIYDKTTLFGWRQDTCSYYEEAEWNEE